MIKIKCEWLSNKCSHIKCTNVTQMDFCALVCRSHTSAGSHASSDQVSLMCLHVSFQRGGLYYVEDREVGPRVSLRQGAMLSKCQSNSDMLKDLLGE